MKIRILRWLPLLLLASILLAVAGAVFYGAKTAQDLLEGNKKLKAALASLSHEDQIGFAKVLRQETRDGKLYSTIRFVETVRGDLLTPVLEKTYEIEGDVVYFDALIITFPAQMVMDGKARSMYLWRRIYGEHQNPADGFPIETPGTHPERYATLLKTLRIPDQKLFWEEIWKLANNPESLRKQGIKAIYGNAVYKRLKPGLIYVFKIGADGQVYPETVPDL
jgi:hypothetical protein